jgi:Flagellar motor protein
MYNFFMDLFENYPGFLTFFLIFWAIGVLAVLYLIALFFYKRIAKKHGLTAQSDIDRKQDEAIESLSRETKKALALEKELEDIRKRIGGREA